MSVEDFQLELSLQMEELIKQDLINHKINEEKRLLDLKNETEKQEIAKQKQIDEENRLKELAIKTARDNEIKQHVDAAVNICKQQMTNSCNSEKQQLKTNYEQQIQTLRTELQTEKVEHNSIKLKYECTIECTIECNIKCKICGNYLCRKGKSKCKFRFIYVSPPPKLLKASSAILSSEHVLLKIAFDKQNILARGYSRCTCNL